MNKLYMISLGGKAKGANIEVHDVQFAVGANIEEAIELVKDNWYGRPLKLHMDSYVEILGADGYGITLSKEAIESDLKVYFIFLGGYSETSTQEVHDVRLMVGSSLKEIKGRAIKDKKFEFLQRHVDSVVEVNGNLLTPGDTQVYLKLDKVETVYDLKPDWFGYRRLDQ